MRKKAEEVAEPPSRPPLRGGARDARALPTARCSQTWAMLIKRVYEIDPMACPQCSGEMKIVSFIDPPQEAVIEKILSGHRRAALVDGLWKASSPRGPPDSVHDLNYECMDQTSELTCVDMDTFLATF